MEQNSTNQIVNQKYLHNEHLCKLIIGTHGEIIGLLQIKFHL